MAKADKKKLLMWQERLSNNAMVWDEKTVVMDRREAMYRGDKRITGIIENDDKKATPHVRNVVSELIESQVSTNIPQPKVAPKRKKDEWLAKIIEDMLRNELDRLPMEMQNDLMERIVPIQGGGLWLVEWDNGQRTHTTVGEISTSVIHPKQIVPQDGVYTSIADMDYIILKIPQTKESIKRKYDVTVEDESESEPEVRGVGTDDSIADDLVTQYIAYYRNDNGGIGLYSWVNDTELADFEDYQARRLRKCKICGATEPLDSDPLNIPSYDGLPPAQTGETPITGFELDSLALNTPKPSKPRKGACPYCGSNKWEYANQDYEEIYTPITRHDGSVIPGATPVLTTDGYDENGTAINSSRLEPTRIPYYKPTLYPIILQRNVSVYGQLLGDSDVDKIADQQNTINRIEADIIDKLLIGGSYMLLPDRADIVVDPIQKKVVYPGSPAEKALFDRIDMSLDIGQDLAYLNQTYEEARQITGITESFQGRRDTTATSGKAKEFAAAQTAGRLESKRVVKDAAFAELFETIFKFKLAYADEPRPVISENIYGDKRYQEFNRYDFLEQDEAGEWYWNDQFLFSCDNTAPLAANREAMWQETRLNLQTGAFGDPASKETLILFWSKMEMLHYPGAMETKDFLKEQFEREQKQQAMMMQQMQIQAQRQAAAAAQQQPPQQISEEEILRKAKSDAARDAMANAGLLRKDTGIPNELT